jgi:DNA polymerase-4
MAVLVTISPRVEKVSIDEAYLDVTGLERLVGPPEVIGRQTKEKIREAVRLTASIGIGPNRLIAKLASDADKPDGLTVVLPGEDRFLPGTHAACGPARGWRQDGAAVGASGPEDGRRRTPTVPGGAAPPPRRAGGSQAGTQIHLQARGIADDQVYPASERKSISKETTFGEDVTDPAILKHTLRWAAQEVGCLARHEQRNGLVVTLKIRFRPFETHTRSRTLKEPTANDIEIFRTAWELFQAESWADRPVRLIGVGISGWDEVHLGVQQDLFDESMPGSHPAQERLDATLDAIRDRFGRGTIQRGLHRRPPRYSDDDATLRSK